MTSVYPFAYAVRDDGTLSDLAGLSKSSWRRLFREARRKDVLVVPTVMWSDGARIHATLSDPVLRAKHIRSITKMVERGRFDGVDIDYESKLATTKDHFSAFLEELREALDEDAVLTCAIEARTPADSLYRAIPSTLSYANDLKEIGTHCDRVQIMAYDQRRADLKLNDARKGSPYMPVADAEWVRKVVVHMSAVIPREKLVLGIPTYGHEYELTVAPEWYKSYARIRALNPGTALELADEKGVTPSRNGAGEVSFSYWALPASAELQRARIPERTPSGNVVAAKALSYASATGNTVVVNIVWWSDAKAVEEKVKLAEELGLAGVALFKIDGEEDKRIWDIFE